MSFPSFPNISVRDLETLADAYAYLLATDSRTSAINWILGDVGMGGPTNVPFGYITILTEGVTWYTAGGGSGGLAAGGPQGLDDWLIPIILTVAYEPHRGFLSPVMAVPPSSSPFNPANLGQAPPYLEQPGWRPGLQIIQKLKAVMRTNHAVGGAATDTRVVESRYIVQEINEQLYRAARVTIQTQQRRTRGL